VIFLPGFLGDARELGDFAAHAGRPVIALDLPRGGPETQARALRPELARIGPAHLLTGSYGGLVARWLGSEAVSWATVATAPDPAALAGGVRRMRRLVAALPGPIARIVYGARLRRRLSEDGLPDALAEALVARGLDRAAVLERLDGILGPLPPLPDVPTLWVVGDRDPEAPWSDSEIRAACPRAEVARVPGGHRPYATHPAPLAEALAGFWARSEAGFAARAKQG
jgi:hypothetical protein